MPKSLQEVMQALGDPTQVEALIDQLSDMMEPPPLGAPQQQPQQPAAAVPQVPQAQPTQGPNLGAAITGQNQVVQPDIAAFLKQLGG